MDGAVTPRTQGVHTACIRDGRTKRVEWPGFRAWRAAPLDIETALRAAVFLAGGALVGVVAAGGQADGAVAQLQGLFDADDLEAGDGGEPLFLSSLW